MTESEPVDLQQQASFAEPTGGRKHKLLWLPVALLVVGGGVGFGVWYAVTPHSAADQFAAAEKLEAEYLAAEAELSDEQAPAKRDEIVEAYRKVFERFEATDEQTAETYSRISQFARHCGDQQRAREWDGRLIETYGDTPRGRQAYDDLIDSYVTEGTDLLAKDRAAAVKLLDAAAETCEKFIARHGIDHPDAASMAMRRCRILDDRIAKPPIRPIKALEEFIEAFGDSDLMDEALFRLGRLHEKIAEPRTAAEYYTRLIEQYGDSKYLKKAEIARARAVSEYDAEAGEALWREVAAKYADDPAINRQASQEADRLANQREQQQRRKDAEAAREQDEEYRRQRYGGGGGGGGGGIADSGWGKPVPPAEMLRDFIDQKLDASHYVLSLSIDPAAHTMSVSGTVDLVNEGDEKRDFLMMLGPLMEVGGFTMDGTEVEVVRPPGKAEVIQVRLSDPWPAGAAATLAFEYTAVVSKLELPEGLDDKMLEQLGRGISKASGRLAAADPAGEQNEKAGSPIPADILSDPRLQLQLNDAGYALSGAAWHPVTIFGDLFTAEITAEVPEPLTFICSGGAAGEEVRDGRNVTRWRCEKPYFGLYFAYGEYETTRRDAGGIKISTHFFSEQADKAEAYLDVAEKIIGRYGEHFGPFPFEKLSLVQAPLPPVLGGVGPASLTFLHAAAVEKLEDVPVSLLAHELSHQWWGNQVPINLIDSRYSQWLSEGFATYSDALYTQWSEGDEPFREHIRKMGELYLDASAHVREDAVVETFMGQSPLYRPVVYEKGALVLHALRYILGDETFFEVLRQYVRTYAFQRSTVDDFRRLASEQSGKDLDWFFDEWLDRPGCPRFELAGVTVGEADEEGVRTVEVSVVQPGRLSRMPMDVVIEGPEGRAKRVRAELGRKESLVKIEVDFEAERVVLDPDRWVLRRTDRGPDAWAASGG